MQTTIKIELLFFQEKVAIHYHHKNPLKIILLQAKIKNLHVLEGINFV